MTIEQLSRQRDDISFKMIEASGRELFMLEQELVFVEELIVQLEYENGKEIQEQI